ncbi:BSD domain [Fagus crenata]
MDLWNRARSLAEETAKRTQDLSIGASKFSDLVSETAKRSKEIAAEASKRAEQIKSEAFKHLAEQISPSTSTDSPFEQDLEKFGVTDELRDFVKEIHITTFQDFPLQDDTQMSDIPTVSNVRQDLTEWQQKHANLVLSTVKEISKLRYELCPRVMKERKFWRIYFILVNRHVAPYEKRYMEDLELKSAEQVQDDVAKESTKVGIISKPEAKEVNQQSKTSSSSTEQDLDAFLLGDPGDTDDGPDDAERDFDDDFDKMVDSSDDEKEKS